ncbi:hypothetical protein V1517DRAFT_350938 [Lipomyces orientalis]|uniref:Uncharacterized protein n=1 Tax=Lipomyces orientalis TaxID=1233043 RepID=A0ACC3TUY8_9ASCO
MSWPQRPAKLFLSPTPRSLSASATQQVSHATDKRNRQNLQESEQEHGNINDTSNRVPCLDLARWAYSRNCEDYFHMPHSTCPSSTPRTAASRSPMPAAKTDVHNFSQRVVRETMSHLPSRAMPLLITVVVDLGIIYGGWTVMRRYVPFIAEICRNRWAEWACWVGVYLLGCAIGFAYAVTRDSRIWFLSECQSADKSRN